jgi:methyl-accepting chemotaxis protein
VIAVAPQEQSAATQEISRNVRHAATGTQKVLGNIGGVTQAAAEAGYRLRPLMGFLPDCV